MLHGYVGIVLPVRRTDGSGAVLKVSWLDADSRWEPHALAAWAGRGAVMLLDRDDSAGVMLLERLDPARSVRELDGDTAAAVAGQVCRRLAVPAPPGLPRLDEMAVQWAEDLPKDWERLGRPFDKSFVDAAAATCYDAAKLLGNRWSELAAQPDLRAAVHRRLAAFADGAEVDVQRARRWAQTRLTRDALWCREHQPEAVPYVDTLVTLLH